MDINSQPLYSILASQKNISWESRASGDSAPSAEYLEMPLGVPGLRPVGPRSVVGDFTAPAVKVDDGALAALGRTHAAPHEGRMSGPIQPEPGFIPCG
ncbi:hypothetical protein K3495_g2671 [Podosphaera aphanis]|nr:hypothetical protein K3495_g2671 [Podosphaera aphanis]